jgi:hypothetical protein
MTYVPGGIRTTRVNGYWGRRLLPDRMGSGSRTNRRTIRNASETTYYDLIVTNSLLEAAH